MTTPDDIQTTNDELDIAHQAFILGEVTANCTKPRQDGSRSWRLRMRRQGPELVSTKDGPSTRRDAVSLSTRLALDIANSNAHATENRPDQAFVDGLLQGVSEWLKERGGLLLDGAEVAAIHELIAEQLPEGLPKGPLVVKVCELAQALSGERLKADKAAAPFAKGAAEHIFAAKLARCMGLDAGQVLDRLQGSDANFVAMVAKRIRTNLDRRYLNDGQIAERHRNGVDLCYLVSDGEDLSLKPVERQAILTALAKPDCTDADILREIVHADAHAEDLLVTGREAWSTLQHLINPFETLVEYGKLQAQTDRNLVDVFRATDVQVALNGGNVSDSPCDLAKQVANLKAERDALAQENAALKVRVSAATIPPDIFEVEDDDELLQHAQAQVEALQELIDQHASSGALRVLSRWVSGTAPPDTAADGPLVAEWLATRRDHAQRDTFKHEREALNALGTFLFQRAGEAFNRLRKAINDSANEAPLKALDESEGAA